MGHTAKPQAVGASGVVILGTSCYRSLEDATVRSEFLRWMDIGGFEVWPTAANVLEVAQTPGERIRSRVVAIINSIASGRPLLPFPARLLEYVGRTIATGKGRFEILRAPLEQLLASADLQAKKQREAAAFLAKVEDQFRQVHETARPLLQREIKKANLQGAWGSPADFLDQQWGQRDNLTDFVEKLWVGLKLPGCAPVDALLANETWKMFLDCEGLAVYQRAMARPQPRQAHRMDLLQLMYLSATQYRRVLVTRDDPFLRDAKLVLLVRYPNARGMHLDDLL